MPKKKIIKRLLKGFPITYRTDTGPELLIRRWAHNLNLTFAYSGTNDKFTAYISGFVVGDTKKKGISVVAEDNTSVCLCSRTQGDFTEDQINDFRELLRRGCYTCHEIHMDKIIRSGSPICQYSK